MLLEADGYLVTSQQMQCCLHPLRLTLFLLRNFVRLKIHPIEVYFSNFDKLPVPSSISCSASSWIDTSCDCPPIMQIKIKGYHHTSSVERWFLLYFFHPAVLGVASRPSFQACNRAFSDTMVTGDPGFTRAVSCRPSSCTASSGLGRSRPLTPGTSGSFDGTFLLERT